MINLKVIISMLLWEAARLVSTLHADRCQSHQGNSCVGNQVLFCPNRVIKVTGTNLKCEVQDGCEQCPPKPSDLHVTLSANRADAGRPGISANISWNVVSEPGHNASIVDLRGFEVQVKDFRKSHTYAWHIYEVLVDHVSNKTFHFCLSGLKPTNKYGIVVKRLPFCSKGKNSDIIFGEFDTTNVNTDAVENVSIATNTSSTSQTRLYSALNANTTNSTVPMSGAPSQSFDPEAFVRGSHTHMLTVVGVLGMALVIMFLTIMVFCVKDHYQKKEKGQHTAEIQMTDFGLDRKPAVVDKSDDMKPHQYETNNFIKSTEFLTSGDVTVQQRPCSCELQPVVPLNNLISASIYSEGNHEHGYCSHFPRPEHHSCNNGSIQGLQKYRSQVCTERSHSLVCSHTPAYPPAYMSSHGYSSRISCTGVFVPPPADTPYTLSECDGFSEVVETINMEDF